MPSLLMAFVLAVIVFNPAVTRAETPASNAANGWIEALAGKQAENILGDVEKQVQLDPNLKNNLKGTIKGYLKDKLKKRFIPQAHSLAMQDIIDAIRDSVNGVGRGACQKAAASIAWSAVQGVNRTLIGMAGVAVDTLLAASGAGSIVEGLTISGLSKTLVDKLRKSLEEALDDYLKNYKIETFTKSTTLGGCDVEIRVVWNKAAGVFDYVILGDCHCGSKGPRGSKVQLGKWSVTGSGKAAWIGEAAEKRNAKLAVPESSLKGTAHPSAPVVRAVCCRDKVPGAGDPWTFGEGTKKKPVCKVPEFTPEDPDYVAAKDFLERNGPDKYDQAIGGLVQEFNNAKCEDRAKILNKMYALRQAFQEKLKEMAGPRGIASMVPRLQRAIDKLTEEIDAANAKMEECGTKRCSYEQSEEYGFAIQTPEECIATTYYISTTTVKEEGFITESGGGPEPNGEPVSGGEPEDGGVPECPMTSPPKITVTPPKSPPPESSPPTTVTEEPKSPPPEKPDLGLVKAKEEVVTLALKGGQTGKAYEGAAVKLLAAAPDIPAEGKNSDSALTSPKAYASDVSAGYSNKDGSVTLSLGAVTADGADKKKDKNAKAKASPAAGAMLSEVKVDDKPKGQLVITMTAVDDAKDVAKESAKGNAKDESKGGSKETPAKAASRGKPKLPAGLATPDSGLCIAHSFRIGNQVTYVARVAKSALEEVKRKVENTEGVYSVEEDPCRDKEVVMPYVKDGAD